MRLQLVSWLAASAVVLAVGASTVSALHARADQPTLSASLTTAGAATNVSDGPSVNRLVHPRVAAPTQTPSRQPARPAHAAPAPPRSSTPSIVIGSYQQQLINRDRAAAGLRPLTWSSCLASVAVANAVRLSRQGWTPPYHTNGPSLDLGCHLGNQAGENVGYWSGGINDNQLNSMFMASSDHHANIMGNYRYVATAWAVAPNGYAYVAVEFG
jgi:uncharacterized protein YkwD